MSKDTNHDMRGHRYFVLGMSIQMMPVIGKETGGRELTLVMSAQVQEPNARRKQQIKLIFPPGTEVELRRLINRVVSDDEQVTDDDVG